MTVKSAYSVTPKKAPCKMLFSPIVNSRDATNLENTEQETGVQKILRNGQLYILREGVLYDATGKMIISK